MAEVNVSLPHCHLCVVCVSFDVIPFFLILGELLWIFLDQSSGLSVGF